MFNEHRFVERGTGHGLSAHTRTSDIGFAAQLWHGVLNKALDPRGSRLSRYSISYEPDPKEILCSISYLHRPQ